MKISYNWLKSYIPEIPEPEKLVDIFTYHLCEVEGIEKVGEGETSDTIFDINILPNRAHDLLSHQGIARELASLLNIPYFDPTAKYKIPSPPARGGAPEGRGGGSLQIKVESEKCRRYMGRIVRNIEVGQSPEWMVLYLESIGQRSINNIVDAANIVMFDCGQPIHCFDLDKVKGGLIIREAKEEEEIITLDNKKVKLKISDLVIADEENVLAIAGVKGGKIAEVDENTKNIIIEIGNFDPISVRKTGRGAGIFTDALKRFENDLSPELCTFAMIEMSALISDNGGSDSNLEFEDVVDIYPKKQEEKKLSFSVNKMSKMLGIEIKEDQVIDILDRYNFKFEQSRDVFEITIPTLRLDLQIEEDMAEEIARIIGYDKVIPKIPKIDFKPKINDTYEKIVFARNKLLSEGYSEVMTYTFCDKGEVLVLESASDKKFLRNNLKNGLQESIKNNQINLPLLNTEEIKIFEIGTVFKKDGEIVNVCYGNKKEIKEISLEEFCEKASPNAFIQVLMSSAQDSKKEQAEPDHSQKHTGSTFIPWSLYPFIVRDIALWIPESIESDKVCKIIKDNAGDLLFLGPELFDEFKKDGKKSYAFRLVFQSYKRTLTDQEINDIMNKINQKITENKGWQIR